MAAIVPTVTDVSQKGDGSCILVVWTPVTSAGADTCVPVQYPEHSDKSIQVTGTFGGGSIAVQGSNIPGGAGGYASLFDPSSTVIAITDATKIKAVLENTTYVAPLLSGGSSTSVTISMLFHMSNPLRT